MILVERLGTLYVELNVRVPQAALGVLYSKYIANGYFLANNVIYF